MAKIRHTLTALVAGAALVLTGCSNDGEGSGSSTSAAADGSATESTAAESVTVEDNEGEKTIEKPIESVAVLDNRSFEILDQWQVPITVGARKLVPSTLPDLKNDESILDVGNHKEPDLEQIVAGDPQLIVSGQRFQKYDEQIEQMNPQATLVDFEPREDKPLDEELTRHVENMGKIFDKEDEAQKLIDDFNKALQRAKDAYDGESTVMAVNVSGGDIGYVAPHVGRTYGPLFDLIGFKPALQIEHASSDHKGDDISVEAIADSNPDLMLVLDRDAAISSSEGASKPAKNVIEESTPLEGVTAVKDGHVYYAPDDTYTNENIITYTEILNGIADQLEAAQK